MDEERLDPEPAPKRPLLVLDLDETLISADLERRGLDGEVAFDEYFVTPRPGLEAFIARVRECWRVGVWTASTGAYAAPILEHFVGEPLEFLWDRKRCTLRSDLDLREWVYLKDIKKLIRAGYAKERILYVDDTPAKVARSYGNYVHIRPFKGDPNDVELDHLAPYLESLANERNFRTIEKRGWRRRI